MSNFSQRRSPALKIQSRNSLHHISFTFSFKFGHLLAWQQQRRDLDTTPPDGIPVPMICFHQSVINAIVHHSISMTLS